MLYDFIVIKYTSITLSKSNYRCIIIMVIIIFIQLTIPRSKSRWELGVSQNQIFQYPLSPDKVSNKQDRRAIQPKQKNFKTKPQPKLQSLKVQAR